MIKKTLSPLFTWRSALAESSLSAPSRHVGLAISLHMSERGDSCFPAIDTLAAETGWSRRRVVSAIAELEEAGYLEVGRSPWRDGHRSPNHYTATVPDGCTTCTRARADGVQITTVTGAPRAPESVIESVVGELPDGSPPTRAGSQKSSHPRPPDPAWDALDLVYGPVTNDAERGRRNRALKAIRQSLNGTPPDTIGEEVRRRAETARALYPLSTEMAVASHWAELGDVVLA